MKERGQGPGLEEAEDEAGSEAGTPRLECGHLAVGGASRPVTRIGA